MSADILDLWTDQTSVLITSFWGWSPEEWGTVGWTGDHGRTRRDNLLKQLTDPFITVIYLTENKTFADPAAKGKIAGFFLTSHETGDRNQFIHPINHDRHQDKWRHSLRALRAFTYLPEHRIAPKDLDPTFPKRALSVAAMGEIITDRAQIQILRNIPCVEVEIYEPMQEVPSVRHQAPTSGYVKAGPASQEGYIVASGTQTLPRQLYVLRLKGDTDAYLGKPANGKSIYKIGLAASPEIRRISLQKSMPRGSFEWSTHRTSTGSGLEPRSFEAAVAGEYAMKRHLAKCAEWLGGEFYLASSAQLDEAWELGIAAAQSFGEKV